jgi:outer membrane protein assembly factor BamB
VAREGHSQLEAAGGRIVVCGTGAIAAEEGGRPVLHSERRGTLRAFTDGGTLLWKHDQGEEDHLWFQIALAMSEDGGTLATFHSDERQTIVRLYEAATGELVWERATPRRGGAACLSVSADGQVIVLCCGDARTWVTAWNREGTPIWEGEIPLPSRLARIGPHGLLVSERWIARLEPEESP